MSELITKDGLDLDFKRTKKSLGMGKGSDRRFFTSDPMFQKIGSSLATIDFQEHLTRFKWNNLPEGMDSELIERILYYNGSAMFFYIDELKQFYFLPYGMTNEGSGNAIDFYGRYKMLRPYSFNGVSQEQKKDSTADIYLGTQIRKNIIDIPLVDTIEDAIDMFKNGGVICFDNTPQLTYNVESRNRVNQGYMNYMIKALIQTKSAMINSSGFNLLQSTDANEADILQLQLDAINNDREDGQLSAIVSNLLGQIQNLQSNNPASMTEFWNTFQAINNLRKSSLGIPNDGAVQKSQYQNISEQQLDISGPMQVYWNAFMERIKFSSIVNSIWGLAIYPEPLLLPTANGTQVDEGAENAVSEAEAKTPDNKPKELGGEE